MTHNMSSLPSSCSQYSKVSDATEEHQQSPGVHQSPRTFKRYLALIWMVLAWVVALALAIGHHLLYAHFDQKRVDQMGIVQGQIIIIATAVVFAVQTLFVLSTTIACTQFQWLTTRSRPFTVRRIDLIFSAPENPLAFLQSRLWLRYPALSLLALVACLLPVATVFPTATLSVTPALQNSTFTTTPRQFYFDPKKYANLQTSQNTYLGPSSSTIKTAYGSALTGQIYQIWTPGYYANMSYTLEFLGPALSCEPASSRLVNDTLTAYLVQLAPFKHEFRFISWVPTISKTPNLVTLTNLDVISSDAAHIYVVPNTAVSGPITAGEQANNSHYGYQDLLDCSLYNASYTVFFNFSNSDQTINILSRKLLNPVTASKKISQWVAMANIPSNITAATRQAQRICYQSIMEVYGKLLVGNNWIGDDFTANTGTTWNMLSIDWTSRDASQKGLEELFQNMTLSMLADSSLTMNQTIADANRVPVTIYSSRNIYAYRVRDLWIAYGIAAAASFLCMCVGIYAMWRNGGCYQTNFSTFMRVTKDEVLFRQITAHDNGAEPLPKDLAGVRLVLGN